MTAEEIARACGQGREKRTSTGFVTLCPAHDDHNPSLSVDEEDGHILVHCQVGCSQAQVVDALKDRGLWPGAGSNGNGNGAAPHLTLTQFANAKGFRADFLTQHGVSQDRGGLVFHYLLLNGQRAARQRIRLALTGDKRFIWNKADGKPVPYGLWRLSDARKQGLHDLFIVEGESDALTLWLHGYTALGVPGSDNCKLLQAPHVTGFARIFIAHENDQGGEVFEKGCTGRLAELEFQGDVRVIEMARANCKDPNELHIKLLGDPGGFESEWGALVEQARSVELPLVGLEVFNAAAVAERPIEMAMAGSNT